MDFSANDAHPSAAGEHSTGDLVKLLSEQVSVLVQDELKLAQLEMTRKGKLEMTRKGKQAASGIGMLGGGGMVAFYGVGCLLASAIIASA